MDFNHTTGEVTPLADDAGVLTYAGAYSGNSYGDVPYGVEFSPTGRALYISTAEGAITYIYQYYVYNYHVPVQSSEKKVANLTSSGREFAMLQFAYDGRIYGATNEGQDYLCVIDRPDNYLSADYGGECAYTLNAVDLTGTPTYCDAGLPMYPNDFFNQCCGFRFLGVSVIAPTTTISTDGRIIIAGYGGSGEYSYNVRKTGDAWGDWQESGLFNGFNEGLYEVRVQDTVYGCEINVFVTLDSSHP